jgi:glyoxylase-like metal-dependent hydrolase (beta-lactamase superfamily II)/rhodanese-related sulfurtransferase
MIFQQFRNNGHLSYLIGDEESMECAILDPWEEIDAYLMAVENKGLTIIKVVDSHSHADHLSGAAKLASQSGAQIVMDVNVMDQRRSSEGKGEEYGIAQILDENGRIVVDKMVREGDEIIIGNLKLKVLETPGHTLDSMCLTVGDRILTGDTLMIGSCGRSDLPGGSTKTMYKTIFNKLHKLRDDLLVYPAHDYSGNINSAVGYEKINNPFFKDRDSKEFLKFVESVFPPSKGPGMQCSISSTPKVSTSPLTTGPLMAQMCLSMEKLLQQYPDDWKKWNLIDVGKLKEKLEKGGEVTILDVREPDEFAEDHIKGSINVPVKELPSRMGDLPRDKDREIITYCESGFRSAHAAIFLKAYGYTNVKYLELGMHEWREEGFEVES